MYKLYLFRKMIFLYAKYLDKNINSIFM